MPKSYPSDAYWDAVKALADDIHAEADEKSVRWWEVVDEHVANSRYTFSTPYVYDTFNHTFNRDAFFDEDRFICSIELRKCQSVSDIMTALAFPAMRQDVLDYLESDPEKYPDPRQTYTVSIFTNLGDEESSHQTLKSARAHFRNRAMELGYAPGLTEIHVTIEDDDGTTYEP